MRRRVVVGIVAAVAFLVAVFIAARFAGDAPPPTTTRAVAVTPTPDRDVDPPMNDEAAPPVAPTSRTSQIPARAPIAEGQGRLHLVVVDRAGAPIARYHAHVAGGLVEDEGGRRRGDEADSHDLDVDDAAGSVDVDLRAGRAFVVIRAPRFRFDSERADIGAGETKTLRVVLDASNAIHGTVRDRATRAPIAAVRVGGVWEAGEVRTDAAGRFDITTLPDARISLSFHADGYRTLTIGGLRGDRSRDEVVDVELDALTDGGPTAEFVGTGFVMGVRDDDTSRTPYVASIYPGTPAAAVLRVGDEIVDIDGTDVSDARASEARALMLGDAVGSTVRLGIRRDGARLQLDLERALIPLVEDKGHKK